MLDYCKTVNFNRNARRMEHAAGIFDQGSSSTSNMPDEIDGDDRLGVSQRSGFKGRTRLESVISDEPNFDLGASMYMDVADSTTNDSQSMGDDKE